MEKSSISSLTEDLVLGVAEFLPAKDLLQFQSVSKELASLDSDAIWRQRCEDRWDSWPRYKLDQEREMILDSTHPDQDWKARYRLVEQDATRTQLTNGDLRNLEWYLSFVLSGVRGEALSDAIQVKFLPNGSLAAPGYPLLPYHIVPEKPPCSDGQIRSTFRGDRPFSDQQYVQIAHFPIHFITRKRSNAEWLIVNEHVMIVSAGWATRR